MTIIARVSASALVAAGFCALAACAGPTGAVPPGAGALLPAAAAAAPAPTYRVFTAGGTPGLPASAEPRDLVVDSTGTVWFTDLGTPAIGRITPDFKVHEFKSGLQSGAQPYAIAIGPDGNLWFTDGSGAIGRVTSSGAIAEFPTPHAAEAAPDAIVAGADGALWSVAIGSASGGTSYLIRVTTAGKASSFAIPRALIPDGSLQADTAGNLWFFASLANHDVVLVQRTSAGTFISHATGLITKGEPCCPNLATNHIATGPDGNLWFTTPYFGQANVYAKLVGTYAAGKATFFDAATKSISYPIFPSGIVGGKRVLWYSGSDPIGANGAIWSLTTAGVQHAYSIPYNPASLASAGNAKLWFTSDVQTRAPQIVFADFRPAAAADRAQSDHAYVLESCTKAIASCPQSGELVQVLGGGIVTNGVDNPVSIAAGPAGSLYIGNKGESNTGSVTIYQAGSTTPQTTIGRIKGNPHALSVDRSGNAYVASQYAVGCCQLQSLLAAYPPNASKPQRYLRDVSPFANAPVFDASGNLYVQNFDSFPGYVSVYAPGKRFPARFIRNGIGFPEQLAAQDDGTLFVLNRQFDGSPNILVYAPGSPNVTRTIATGLRQPLAIALDDAGNLYVANYGTARQPGSVAVYAAGSASVARSIQDGTDRPVSLAFDGSGALFVANAPAHGASTVSVYAAGGSSPLETYQLTASAIRLAVER